MCAAFYICLSKSRFRTQFSPNNFYSPTRGNFIDLFPGYSGEMEARIEIFMLKLVCEENFVLFGHSEHELQLFKNLVFSINLYGICRWSDNVIIALAYSIQMYSKN